MAYSPHRSFLFFCLLLIRKSFASAEENYHLVLTESLLPSSICSTPIGTITRTRLNVVHRYGPCSPLPQHPNPSHVDLLRRDQSRVDSIHGLSAAHRHSLRGSLTAKIPATSGAALGAGNYIVTIGLGTPKHDYSVEFDTGSDLTWVQCEPCKSCYRQKDPIFDPAQSSTSTNISCRSSFCRELYPHGCASDFTCGYLVGYGDGSYSIGSLLQDTLTLSGDAIPDFRYGCGHHNSLFGKADGLLGLGRRPESVVSQAAQKYGKVFSYCLPSTSSYKGFLALGEAAAGVQYTPMLTNTNMPTFYFVKLLGIAVGGQQLAVSQTVFTAPGTLVDSGTVISRLPPAAYSALRTRFRTLMSNYSTAPAFSLLDTCYNLTKDQTVRVPSISLIFDGGLNVNLDSRGILYVVSVSQVCLAFAANRDARSVVIVGNVQQRSINVVYDVANLRIGFGRNGCN